MISHKYQCIFVHIPKTGGTSIESLLWPRRKDRSEANLWMGYVKEYYNKYQTGGMQHLFASHIEQEIGAELFKKYYKFALVRNPWDKAVSQFVYMQKRKDLRDFIGMKAEEDFKNYLQLIQKKLHVQWEHQYKFIYNENGDLLVDFVGRFEDFNREVESILEKINYQTHFWGIRYRNIPHKYKGERRHYSEYYDDESREMLGEIYQEDIKRFGYKF